MREDYNSAGMATVSPARRIVSIGVFLIVATTAIFLFHGENPAETAPVVASQTPPATEASSSDSSSNLLQTGLNDALAVPEASTWSRIVVGRGESLSTIFESQGLPPEDWILLTRIEGDCARLKRIKAGDELNLRLVAGHLEEMNYALDETRMLNVRRGARGFEATTLTTALEHRQAEGAGVIRNSLFADGRKAGLPDRMILEFADIFGYDIDFAQDLQEGDRFTVVYDQLYKDGKKLREGDILAAEFVNQGRSYRAVRFVDSDGRTAYYTPEGQSLRKAFIRTPVDFARISSGFNLHRLHPILNIIRAHKGVDYAAAIGTPVHATGDGRVEFLGQKGGYGNVLIIRHGAQYETVYGHLSRFQSGLRVGGKVRQGQIVAYVGMTGLATAPHLHYEFRVNGIHQNPVTVALPRAIPLNPQVLAGFRTQAAPWVAEIEALGARRFATAATP